MTAQATHDHDGVTCWCCASVEPEDRVVRLGDHPEVALCLGCARWAANEAWGIEDREKTGALPRLRDVLRRIRLGVIQQGWHRKPVVGPLLRWLGRFVP